MGFVKVSEIGAKVGKAVIGALDNNKARGTKAPDVRGGPMGVLPRTFWSGPVGAADDAQDDPI
jgi:hypothetical protein